MNGNANGDGSGRGAGNGGRGGPRGGGGRGGQGGGPGGEGGRGPGGGERRGRGPGDKERGGRGRGDGRRGGRGDRRGGKERGGPGDRGDRKAWDRSRRIETIKELVPAVDRPMVKGDFAGQVEPLTKMREAVAGAGLGSMDDLGVDMKGKLLTLLLRVGRQTKQQDDPEKEASRAKALEALARVWLAFNDTRRASMALQAAGKEDAAAALLDQSGDWKAQVALFRATGEVAKAAKVLEAEGESAEAAEAYAEVGDAESRLRVLVKLGDEAKIVEALDSLPKEKAEDAAVRHGILDAWAKVLTERQDWEALARLYQGYGQHAIAARAWEEAGDFRKAMKSYRLAGDEEGHDRCVSRLVDQHREKNDLMGAARVLAGAGKLDQAAELASEKHPEDAHQWYVEGGYKDRALELARREARKAEGHQDYRLRALWLERAEDLVPAATFLEGMGELERAQKLYQQARAWAEAARCAEARGKLDEAVELYYRANLPEEAERAKLLG